MKKREVTLIAFADFSKAFDTVDYLTVLRKLHAIGFSTSSLTWVLNYLTSRKQFVQVNDKQFYLFLFYNLCHMTGLTHRASCSFTGNLLMQY